MTDDDRGLDREPAVRFFFEAVTYMIQDRSVITGRPAVGGKHGKYKFRAIADGSTAEIGETDRWVEWARAKQTRSLPVSCGLTPRVHLPVNTLLEEGICLLL
ncbi:MULTISPECIES: hypothetical protein [unclassified Microcoleus]